jgi:hypothetical protein
MMRTMKNRVTTRMGVSSALAEHQEHGQSLSAL